MAGLKEAFRNAAAAAFAAADDVKEEVVLRVKASSNPSYTPSSDTISDSYTDYTVNAIPSGYDSREVNGRTILDTDEKIKILVADITNITPKRTDQIVRDSVVWEIENVHKDPADAVWTLQVRKP
jgi:hypothetical protein